MEEKIEQQFLQARLLGMDAGRDKGQRGCAAAVNFGCSVDVGARSEEKLCDLDGIGRSFLAISFDTVGGDVVEKRGAMLASRARVNQLGILVEKRG